MHIGRLFDCYGSLLTGKQRKVVEQYYDEDLSLAEIGQLHNISKQGVHELLKRAIDKLMDYEDKLGILKKYSTIESTLIFCADELKSVDLTETLSSEDADRIQRTIKMLETLQSGL